MHDIRTVAFDLDGTLVDSAPDLAVAVNKSLDALGTSTLDEQRVVAMIGDGIEVLMERALDASLGRPPRSAEKVAALRLVVEKYAECVVDRSAVYPGVREGLNALRARGMRICCVTNKYSQLSLPLLRALGLEDYFCHVLCAETPAQRKPAPVLLQEVCRRERIAPDHLLMVGDTREDIAAARAAGCRVAAVSYGYNSRTTLATDRPDWTIDSLVEISANLSGAGMPTSTTDANPWQASPSPRRSASMSRKSN